MLYKTNELAKLSGVTSRTLRYYDLIGLLSPKRDEESNYRYYNSDDVDTLQQILLFKEMGLELAEIKKLISTLDKDKRIKLLTEHLKALNLRKIKLEQLVNNVQNTIKTLKGESTMSDKDKFKGLKEELIRKNDKEYKDEVISKWSEEKYETSQNMFMDMTKEKFDHFNNLFIEIIEVLKKIKQDENNEDLKKKVAFLHKEWLTLAWGYYDRSIHLNIVDMYIQDERFEKTFNEYGLGLTKILRDAVHKYI